MCACAMRARRDLAKIKRLSFGLVPSFLLVLAFFSPLYSSHIKVGGGPVTPLFPGALSQSVNSADPDNSHSLFRVVPHQQSGPSRERYGFPPS